MLLPLTCLKRDFLKVLQSLRGYIDTILPKSLGHIVTLAYRQACPEAVVRDLCYAYVLTEFYNERISLCCAKGIIF